MWRVVWKTAVRHGRDVFEGIFGNVEKYIPKKKSGVKIWKKVEAEKQNVGVAIARKETANSAKPAWKDESLLGRFLSRNATKCLASELRQRFSLNTAAGSYSMYGLVRGGSQCAGRLSRLAFVSMCLAGGSQLQTRQQQDLFNSDNSVCDYIKTLFKDQTEYEHWQQSCSPEKLVGKSVSDYNFGDIIAKGSNAVVYEASRLDTEEPADSSIEVVESEDGIDSSSTFEHLEQISEEEGEIPSLESTSIELISSSSEISDASFLYADPSPVANSSDVGSWNRVGENLAGEFDLAIKMMFNYDVESKATSIFHHMQKELVPLQMEVAENDNIWHNWNHVKKKRLPPHPNIVVMKDAFTDDMPALASSLQEYPDALPKRLYTHGYGRNKTLFIVMKRYELTLEEYVWHQVPSVQESCVLLAQLLEAVIHINHHNIAHRDLKSNNLLLDQSGTSDWPQLVVSDFGCCTTEGLSIPFQTEEVDRGGNPLLMAPEISRAKPGLFSYLDYSKADLWAVGAIAYEMFGGENPFYPDTGCRFYLDTLYYENADLPDLPNHVPSFIGHIVHMMLHTDPDKRPEAVVVSDMIHFVMWCPEEWREGIAAGSVRPSLVDLRRWLLLLSAETILHRRLHVSHSRVEQTLKEQFLSRLNISRLCKAVELLWKECCYSTK